jgi:hypothetical protein
MVLLLNLANVRTFDHSAYAEISFIGTALSFPFDTAAERTLCDPYLDVLIPDFSIIVFNHLDSVSLHTL